MLQEPPEGIVRSFFRHVVTAFDRSAGNPRSVIPPDCEHIAVHSTGMALCPPEHEQRTADRVAGLPVGFVHLEIAGRAGAIIFAGAADRLPGKTADILGESLGVEKAEPDPRLR